MICNWKKVTLTEDLDAFRNVAYGLWMALLFVAYGVSAQADAQKTTFDILNPDASLGGTNGFGMNGFIGGTGSYAATSRGYGGSAYAGAGGPNLGNAVNPATLARYLNGLKALQNLRAIPSNPSRLTPAQQQQLSVIYNSLIDMEQAQYEILAFFGSTYITLNTTLGKLAYALGRPRPSYGPNSPVATAFGLTGVGKGAAGGVDDALARKVIVQLRTSSNQTLYDMAVNSNGTTNSEGLKELKRYQNILSDIVSAPVPPDGVSIEDAQKQFLRVQRAIAKDSLMSTHGTSYDLPAAGAANAVNASYQKIQAIVNKWNLSQATLAKIPTVLNAAPGDRQILVAAKQQALPPQLADKVEITIAQIDAAQLGVLNRGIESIDFEQHLTAFKKSMVYKAQNVKESNSPKTVDVAWISDKIDEYNDLIGKVSARGKFKDADADLVRGFVAIIDRSKENLAKLKRYKDIFDKAASTPVKRINLELQTNVEKVFMTLTPLITTANILQDNNFSSYETVLKQVLASPESVPDSITILQVRKMYRVLQKAKGIILLQQLRKYQKVVQDIAVGRIDLSKGKDMVTKSLAINDEKDFVNETAGAQKAGGVLKTSNAENAGKSQGDAEIRKKIDGLAGVVEAMDQLAQLVLNGVFLTPATFGNMDISDDQVRAELKKMNRALMGIEYQNAVALNTKIATEAQSAVNLLQGMLKGLEAGDGRTFPPNRLMADLKSIKMSLIYDVAMGESKDSRENLLFHANALLLTQLMNSEFKDLERKFDESIQNTTVALRALDILTQLVEVEDTQGEARARARSLISRLTAYLDKK